MPQRFRLATDFSPCGDQPRAIAQLVAGVEEGKKSQVLLGVTGSGKTFTVANVIATLDRPALILAHNKTLAAQLYQEFKHFFPDNAVEYFVSYYDYYQPEAYVARTDTYIEKALAINDQIDRMRLAATRALLQRRDVIIVASVSCIYGLGLPEYYSQMQLTCLVGQQRSCADILEHLQQISYKRNQEALQRATFRTAADTLEVMPAEVEHHAYRITFAGDAIDAITVIDARSGAASTPVESITLFPSSHHVLPEEVRTAALQTIRQEVEERAGYFAQQQRYQEMERIRARTLYDLDMIAEMGFCKGIENYSRHFSRRSSGEPPPCLLDYFPDDFLFIVDESHQTLPQLRAMANGDRGRKKSLVEFGFRLPSAFDNRPLRFEEVAARIGQAIFVSATPGKWEVEQANDEIVEQVVRPTGLLDPEIEVRPAAQQVDDCLEEVRRVAAKGSRTLLITLTKRLAEDLTQYLGDIGVKARYLHSDIDTIERVHILQELRKGSFDVLVGINLLREGLDLPEVELIAIFDADKEGFLRSETALIQICGRAARNIAGRVIMYADVLTPAIQRTLQITHSRRQLQRAYNQTHGITPQSVAGRVVEELLETFGEKQPAQPAALSAEELVRELEQCQLEMQQAAKELRFDAATRLRDRYLSLKSLQAAAG